MSDFAGVYCGKAQAKNGIRNWTDPFGKGFSNFSLFFLNLKKHVPSQPKGNNNGLKYEVFIKQEKGNLDEST